MATTRTTITTSSPSSRRTSVTRKKTTKSSKRGATTGTALLLAAALGVGGYFLWRSRRGRVAVSPGTQPTTTPGLPPAQPGTPVGLPPVQPGTPVGVPGPGGVIVPVGLPAPGQEVFTTFPSAGVVATNDLPLRVRTQPNTSAQVIGNLPRGTPVNVISSNGQGWLQIRDGEGNIGWVCSTCPEGPPDTNDIAAGRIPPWVRRSLEPATPVPMTVPTVAGLHWGYRPW